MAYSIKDEVIFRDGVEIGVLVAPGDVDYTGDAEKYHPHVVKMLKKQGMWETNEAKPEPTEPIAAPPMEKSNDETATDGTDDGDTDSNDNDTATGVPSIEEAPSESIELVGAATAPEEEEGDEVPEQEEIPEEVVLTVRDRVKATEKKTGVKAPEWKHWLGDHNPEIIAYLNENEG